MEIFRVESSPETNNRVLFSGRLPNDLLEHILQNPGKLSEISLTISDTEKFIRVDGEQWSCSFDVDSRTTECYEEEDNTWRLVGGIKQKITILPRVENVRTLVRNLGKQANEERKSKNSIAVISPAPTTRAGRKKGITMQEIPRAVDPKKAAASVVETPQPAKKKEKKESTLSKLLQEAKRDRETEELEKRKTSLEKVEKNSNHSISPPSAVEDISPPSVAEDISPITSIPILMDVDPKVEPVKVESPPKPLERPEIRKLIIRKFAPEGSFSLQKLKTIFRTDEERDEATSLLSEIATSKGGQWNLKKSVYAEVDVDGWNYSEFEKTKIRKRLSSQKSERSEKRAKSHASQEAKTEEKKAAVAAPAVSSSQPQVTTNGKSSENLEKSRAQASNVVSEEIPKLSTPQLFREWENKFLEFYNEYTAVRKSIRNSQIVFEGLKTKFEKCAGAIDKAKVEQEIMILYSKEQEKITKDRQRHEFLQKHLDEIKVKLKEAQKMHSY